MNADRAARRGRDAGSILPLVLVMAVVLSAVIAAVASYVTTGLAYSRVVEDRADRLAAADGGLRYGLERLGDSQYAKCLSNLGNSGTKVEMPTQINGADVSVTCYDRDGGLSAIKAWAIILTGAGMSAGDPSHWLMQSLGSGDATQAAKLLGGPVWVSDPSRTDLNALVTVEDGDVWFYQPNCDSYSMSIDPLINFTPAYRGPICVDRPWTDVFSRPITPAPGTFDAMVDNPAPDTTTFPGCSVFSPGEYTTMPPLTHHNYFKSGDYLFDDFTFNVSQAVVTFGWADFEQWGDQQFIANLPCETAIQADRASGSASGATIYMADRASIDVSVQGSLEILRRVRPDGNLVSVQALSNYDPSELTWNDNIITTGSGNTSDLAIHGLAWAPYAMMTFGNVTNSANGQLLGGAAFARVSLQASASADAFMIRVETAPVAFNLKIVAEATKNGQTTTMSAIVQVDDRLNSAINSIRVVDS